MDLDDLAAGKPVIRNAPFSHRKDKTQFSYRQVGKQFNPEKDAWRRDGLVLGGGLDEGDKEWAVRPRATAVW